MSWDLKFPDPIEIPDGKLLACLRDAGNYITSLSKAQYDAPEWQTAMHILIQAADHGGPIVFARIGMMQALYPKGTPVYGGDRRNPHWRTRRKKVNDR